MAKTTMFERSHTKVRFANEDMDYLFQVVLGYHTYGGASFGARPLDPSLTLTRTQRPAIVSNPENRKPFTYAGFANPCNPQQPLTAHS